MSEQLKDMCILYAEDEAGIREQIAHFMGHRCGKLVTAGNGREALELFRKERPDLVVSDILMPEMDGLDFAAEVKAASPATPVILTTAFNDTKYMVRAIDIGVDAYVLKPVNLEKLLAALDKHAGVLLNARAFAASRAQLEAYYRAAEEERRLVAGLMQRMMRPERMADPQVRHWLQPTDVVDGDLIAVSRARGERLYVMLADSTGHGLPAVLNLLSVNHIFYSMVDKGLPVSMIVEEMNWAVKEQSPIERFVAAFVACIDNHNRVVEVWNGSIPAALLVGEDGEAIHSFGSANLPLGVLDRTFTAQTEIYQGRERCQLFIFSDGVTEAEGEQGEAFGEARLRDAIKRAPGIGHRFDSVCAAVNLHLGTRRAADDMTLLMVDCPFGQERA